MDCATILSLDDFATLRETQDLGVVVCTSGGYDPIHPGHVSCILGSRPLGDTLVVVVNGDGFLRAKKGKPFQDLATRCDVVSSIRGVDYVIPFEIEGDTTVTQALEAVRPNYFTKGGDRVKGKSMPPEEEAVCTRHGIEIVDGVGRSKQWSSSDFLREWGEFWMAREARRAAES